MSLADIISLKVIEEDKVAALTFVCELGPSQPLSGCLGTRRFQICMNDSHMKPVTNLRKMGQLKHNCDK